MPKFLLLRRTGNLARCAAGSAGKAGLMKRFARKTATQYFAAFLLLLCWFPALASAQNSRPRALPALALLAQDAHVDRLAAVEQAAADAKTSGDNAWMLTSSALVLL